ncbi:MAG: class I SAM-dependent methyltransferase [bacterium]|nr:class I SAM-dependent methyltransferase [bacterium]MDT8395068.1 class I SAM-dependent methyltransferase [bacterium]
MSTPGYFDLRRMNPPGPDEIAEPPEWLEEVLTDPGERVLEVGCGSGVVLKTLRDRGYFALVGVDVDQWAVTHCREAGLDVRLISSIQEFTGTIDERFDLVLMLHVLEHLEKDQIIASLTAIRSRMAAGGRIVVSVPNAQSPTGGYWAYEDFTHSTIFTSGSLYHVLSAAGFTRIELVDPVGLAGLGPVKAALRKALVSLYGWTRTLVNRMTGSSWHGPSPRVYTFEVKAVAYNR